jgi:hypothetical protein
MGMRRAILIASLLCAAIAPAHALTDQEEQAKAHFLAGQSYYDQASYTDALREFHESYRISHKPALLYNIARCHEALEQYAEAVTMLERYLSEAPQAPDRAAIEARIAHLQARQADAALRLSKHPSEPQARSRPPTPAATSTTSPPAPRRRLWTWVVGGVGLAALAAAVGTGAASQNLYNDLQSKCPDGRCDPARVSGAQSQIARGHRLSLATDVLWPVGAAAVAAAVALFFLEGRHAPRRHARLSPFIAPSAGGLALAHDF